MTTKKSQIGQIGEEAACEYLVNKKFIIIERNFRKPWGELDIVAKAPDGTLVFIEVKTLRHNTANNAAIAGLQPEDNLTAAKLRKLQRTAMLYVGYNPDLVDDNLGWQIDLIAISLRAYIPREFLGDNISREALTNIEKCCDIKHFENI